MFRSENSYMEKTSPLSFGRQDGADRRFDYFASIKAAQLRVGQPGKQRGRTDLLKIGWVHVHKSKLVYVVRCRNSPSCADTRVPENSKPRAQRRGAMRP